MTPHESAGIDLKIGHGFRQREIKVQPQNRGKIPWLRLDATINANKEPGDGVFKGSVPHSSMTRTGHNGICRQGNT